MSAYSFLNVQASIVGPGLVAQIGSTSGAAKDGLTTAFEEDKSTVTTGSDGSIMTSLKASQTGRITVRLLKTSPINAQLNRAYNFQRNSAILWALNNIYVTDKARGDVVTGRQLSFAKHPDNVWSEEGNILEWSFIGIVNEILGIGLPEITNP